MMCYLIVMLVPLLVLWAFVRKILSCGMRIPVGNGLAVRRWVKPENPEVQCMLADQLALVCSRSIGDLLPHPVLNGKHDELCDKIVLVVYDRQDRPLMFNMMLQMSQPASVTLPVYHMGLVMVDSVAKGRGLQKYTMLNLCCLLLSHAAFILTDVGNSPSAARLMSTFLYDVHPDYKSAHEYPTDWHLSVADHLMNNYRADIAISKNAEFVSKTFVIKYSNEPSAGGAAVLNDFASERRSYTDGAVNQYFDKHLSLKTYDELLIVGKGSWMCPFLFILQKLWKGKS